MEYRNPTVGTSVFFVFKNALGEIVKRPAIVVDHDGPLCNLNVFVDGSRDMAANWIGQVLWRTDVPYDPEDSGQENTWVWPKRRGI